MPETKRRAYVALWVLALALGWIEAAVLVYLRDIYLHEVTSATATVGFPLVSLPARLVGVEVIREACTLVVLGVVAWLADRRPAVRTGTFLLLFGVWDLTYYGVLKLVLGWPDSLTAWDILFLIPLPWVAPVWAPATVAVVFVVAGSYLFWTPDRPRLYRRMDVAVLFASAAMVLAAFLVEWKVVVDKQVPQSFPVWLFWGGVLGGTLWFVRVERRGAGRPTAPPWLHVRIRPDRSLGTGARPEPTVDAVISDYSASRQRLARLLDEAADVGERLERLGHGLSAHPARMVIESERRVIDRPDELDVVIVHSLPEIGSVITLTDEIRDTARHVEELRERLILIGRPDVVEQPDAFFR